MKHAKKNDPEEPALRSAKRLTSNPTDYDPDGFPAGAPSGMMGSGAFLGNSGVSADSHQAYLAKNPTAIVVSPIGIKEPGMIGVMEPLSGEENGHPGGVKNGWLC